MVTSRIGGEESSNKELERYFPIAQAFTELLFPHAEAVIHDASNHRIAAIFNSFSNREQGDPSAPELKPDFDPEESIIGPYGKMEAAGRRKSISVTLTGSNFEVIGMLCVNLDLSRFDAAISLLSTFTAPTSRAPAHLFEHSLDTQIRQIIDDELRSINKAVDTLDRSERTRIVQRLDEKGVFQGRNAVPLTSAVMGVSRASLYKFLKDARELAKSQ